MYLMSNYTQEQKSLTEEEKHQVTIQYTNRECSVQKKKKYQGDRLEFDGNTGRGSTVQTVLLDSTKIQKQVGNDD